MSLPHAHRIKLFQQALSARSNKKLEHAATLLHRLTMEAPDFAPAYTELGVLLAETGKPQQAVTYLQKAVNLAPGDVNCLWALADFYRRHDDWTLAHACFEQAVKLAPSNASILKGFLSTQQARQDHAGALTTIDRILAIEPGNLAVAAMRGDTLNAIGRLGDALAQFEVLLTRPDLPPLAIERWAGLMIRLDRGSEAIDLLENRLRLEPGNVELWLLLSTSCFSWGKYLEAIDALEKVHQLQPGNMRALHDIGVIMRFLGRFDESRHWFGRMLELDPSHAHALRLYGEMHKYHDGDEAIARLNRAAERIAHVSPAEQTQLNYALGKAHDDLGNYATAFQHYLAGGRTHLAQYPRIHDAHDKHIQFAKAAFSPELFDAPPEPGCGSDLPVFVLGMPRSGTSLVEQILASHPDVHGAGELMLLERVLEGLPIGNARLEIGVNTPFFMPEHRASYRERGEKYLDALSSLAPPGASRVIDKMPENFWWVGPIRLILPRAKIIHCRRHPVEICLSAFRTFFDQGHLYSYDLAALGRNYRRYDDLMALWRSRLPPDSLLEVRYEDIVFDFENQAQRLIRFIGLEWNSNCLNFHSHDRAVLTASASQVRKPVYETSTNRWRKYEAFLKPLLDELGPLVEQYESELKSNLS